MNVEVGVGVLVEVAVGVGVSVGVNVGVGVGVDVGVLVKVGVGVGVPKMASRAEGCQPQAMIEMTTARAMAPTIKPKALCELLSVLHKVFTPVDLDQPNSFLESDGTRSHCPVAGRMLQPPPVLRWV